jgi:hypothetical protein
MEEALRITNDQVAREPSLVGHDEDGIIGVSR